MCSFARGASLLVAVALGASSASAEPVTILRMASGAPDGTAWARELKSMGDSVDVASRGTLRLKWYLGGVTGDEVETFKRMEKGQLDGVASGGAVCERIAPS